MRKEIVAIEELIPVCVVNEGTKVVLNNRSFIDAIEFQFVVYRADRWLNSPTAEVGCAQAGR